MVKFSASRTMDDYESFIAELDEVERSIDASQESVTDELMGDGILKTLVGAFSGKVYRLAISIPKCKKKLGAVLDELISRRSTEQGVLWMFGRVKSRFLMHYDHHLQSCEAIIKVANYLSGIKSYDKFDEKKVYELVKGSFYYSIISEMIDASTSKVKKDFERTNSEHVLWGETILNPVDWLQKYILLRIGGYIGFGAAAILTGGTSLWAACVGAYIGMVIGVSSKSFAKKFCYDAEQPIGDRGWYSKERLMKGLDVAEKMIMAVHKAELNIENLIHTKKGSSYEMHAVANTMRFCQNSTSELGRGIVHAVKGVTSNTLVRMFWNNRVYA